ncbi:hypothetical protein SUGI_0533720 [Cryptomeria japonica]|nr:hypothetical protein SUGI_0533720 [Cryptomeria japonica]
MANGFSLHRVRPERGSPRLNKCKSKTYGNEIPPKDKADAPCGYLQSVGTRMNEKSGKRKLGEFLIDTEVTLSEDIEKTSGYPVNTCKISANANLKRIELHAYHSILKAFYLKGQLTWEIEVLLRDLREVLHITHEEHATELRRIIYAQRK